MAIWAVVISQMMNFGVGNLPPDSEFTKMQSGVSVQTEVFYAGGTAEKCEETRMSYVYQEVATTAFKPKGPLDKTWNSWLYAETTVGGMVFRTFRCMRIDAHRPDGTGKSFSFEYNMPRDMQRRIAK